MAGVLIGALLLTAFWLTQLPLRAAPKLTLGTEPGPSSNRPSKFRRGRRRADPHEFPLFVHQLAGLLQAGRSPLQLWEDILEVHQDSPNSGFSASARPVLESARQAATLGISVPEVLREAAARSPDAALRGLWVDLAACIEVSERSGAPLAGVLARYAAQRESQLDSDAARNTALAGPKATVRLLSWLPLFGLLLAYLIGVDPLAVLLGSPPGMAALMTGILLLVSGRLWSSRLVRAAEEEPR